MEEGIVKASELQNLIKLILVVLCAIVGGIVVVCDVLINGRRGGDIYEDSKISLG